MTKKQIDRLSKMLCPHLNCNGYLFNTHDSMQNNILRCRECSKFIFKDDYDIILLKNINKNSNQDDYGDNNLYHLNNL